jgi:hypothetical protein
MVYNAALAKIKRVRRELIYQDCQGLSEYRGSWLGSIWFHFIRGPESDSNCNLTNLFNADAQIRELL